ncbi:MAG TPA: GAF domain-containing protein [Casimicrobiaceae bacterium]|nr:GAF domain-containing protein [Casimicrobiaceae bacterium]
MTDIQSIAADLLLATGASRVVCALAADEGWRFAAEAVTHGARQIRNDGASTDVLLAPIALQQLQREHDIVVQDDVSQAEPPVAATLVDRYGVRAQILAPVFRDARLAGLVAVHHSRGPRHWEQADVELVRKAQAATSASLDARDRATLTTGKEDLRDAAIQAILDRVRKALRVQRCTLRQNVSAAYAFPVTHESRGEGVWSLLGDFTIIQSGQPVIEKMLAERTQVVQNDTRNASAEPLFHVMLEHYGDMRAQIVTPLFREDSLAAVLSVHSLKELRTWSAEETALARSAARLLGLLVGATLA